MHAVADRRKRPAHYAWTGLVSMLPSPRSLTRAAARRARSLLKAVALRATGPSMLRTGPGAAIWRAVATAPGLPTKARSRMAMRVADSLQKVDRSAEAVLTLTSAADRTHGLCQRADLVTRAALLELEVARFRRGSPTLSLYRRPARIGARAKESDRQRPRRWIRR